MAEIVRQLWLSDGEPVEIEFRRDAAGWRIFDPTTPETCVEDYQSIADCEEQLELEGCTKLKDID